MLMAFIARASIKYFIKYLVNQNLKAEFDEQTILIELLMLPNQV